MDKVFVVEITNYDARFTAVVGAENETRAAFLAGFAAGSYGPTHTVVNALSDDDRSQLDNITVTSITEAAEGAELPQDEVRITEDTLLSSVISTLLGL
jgi:hypothetical protein